ncbi:MAG: DUF99 family protein [Betaproteobacteria bacterium]|nr:DUF99 family protein [Betaproteobacteria bacterium]
MHSDDSGPTRLPKQPHVIAFDDAPFAREHRGNVLLVGAVFAGLRLEGVVTGAVRRDGRNATRVIASLIAKSRFRQQLHAVLLQGIAVAGFNVVDLAALHREVALPVLVVARRKPDLTAIRRALLDHVRGGARKWRLIERAGPMEAIGGLWVQRTGISSQAAEKLLARLTPRGRLPEPIRTAHLIAGALAPGESRHRA